MTILVTGIAGFIGSNLGERLISQGYDVIGLDNFDPFYSREIKERNLEKLNNSNQFSFFEADIRDIQLLTDIFKNHKVDAVVHLAAKAGVRPSLLFPQEYFDVNVLGTLNILEAMRSYEVKKMIFASSSSVYGNNKKVPFAETDNVDFPISPYAASKKSGELLCHTYHHLYGFHIFCLRFFTVYGPRQRPDLAIHKFTKALFEDTSIPFYGDGSTKRDYTHINDIIQGITGSLERLEGFDIFNLGESKTISLIDLIDLLERYTRKKANLNYLPLQSGDVKQTYADISKARNQLAYTPVISIEKGLQDFINWYKEINSLQ
jgi:UDP-glucuronate 4-epimerase